MSQIQRKVDGKNNKDDTDTKQIEINLEEAKHKKHQEKLSKQSEIETKDESTIKNEIAEKSNEKNEKISSSDKENKVIENNFEANLPVSTALNI